MNIDFIIYKINLGKKIRIYISYEEVRVLNIKIDIMNKEF